jgi:hypothetical protein
MRPSDRAPSREEGKHRFPRRFVMAMVLVAFATANGGSGAQATVSIALAFEDLLQRSVAGAVVTPVEQHTAWEGGRIRTYTHVRVDRLVAGRLPDDVWVRTQGGAVGHIEQLVEGEATFVAGTKSLVFLREHDDSGSIASFGVVEGAQGQFPLFTSENRPPRLSVARGQGALLPPPGAPRLARDVLVDRSLDDAVRIIGDAWRRFHASEAR